MHICPGMLDMVSSADHIAKPWNGCSLKHPGEPSELAQCCLCSPQEAPRLSEDASEEHDLVDLLFRHLCTRSTDGWSWAHICENSDCVPRAHLCLRY